MENKDEYSQTHICLEIWTKRFYQVTVKYLTMGGYNNYIEVIVESIIFIDDFYCTPPS
jgi:hypothetical protein